MHNPNRVAERWTPQPSGANPAHYTPARVPTVDTVMQVLISLVNISILAVLLTRRVVTVKHWNRLQPLTWLVMFIYVDSTLFVVLSAVVSLGIGGNISIGVCLFADYLCLASYLSTKLVRANFHELLGIYYFLVEKVYLIRSIRQPRLKDKLYIFHAFGLVVFYFILTILQFVYRIAYIGEEGQCYSGIQADVLLPLLLFDFGCNIYLMVMFIIPLRQLMSYSKPNSLARQIAVRTLIGTTITLASSVINMTQLIIVQGERSWLCLITCNLDILLSALVIQWITARDDADTGATTETSKHRDASNGESRNERTMIRPEKPVMVTIKKKRRSTDYSDLEDFDDVEGGLRLEDLSDRKGLGANSSGGNDGNLDLFPSTIRFVSGEAGFLEEEAMKRPKFNPNLAIQKHEGRLSVDRSPTLREMNSSDSISMTGLQSTSSADSTTRFVDDHEFPNKRKAR